MNTTDFFDALWEDFIQLAPQAAAISTKLLEQGETVINDHVAFNTFNIQPFNIESLEPILFSLGYQRLETFDFAEKHLNACSYTKPTERGQPAYPMIFFSELKVETLSEMAQQIIHRLVTEASEKSSFEKVLDSEGSLLPLFYSGRLWSMISFDEYQLLSQESEYAAWLAVHGFHPNHFTLHVNQLKQYPSIDSILNWVEAEGFNVNQIGGRIKGNPTLLLEQGATMADPVPVQFSCGHNTTIPGGYYEFALRYPDANNELFRGFVEAHTDFISQSYGQRAVGG